MATIKKSYGSYRLEVDYKGDFAQVRVDDVGNIKFPMLFTEPMSYEDADKYIALFEDGGYFEPTDMHCNKCGHKVYKCNYHRYSYTCAYCWEDLYGIEVH